MSMMNHGYMILLMVEGIAQLRQIQISVKIRISNIQTDVMLKRIFPESRENATTQAQSYHVVDTCKPHDRSPSITSRNSSHVTHYHTVT